MSLTRGPNPIWFMANLTGQPLDDRYYAFFLTNTLPPIPQPVWQDPNGISLWVNPIEFQPSSGLPNNLYFDPNLTYRIEIRKGNTQNDPLIWLIENYVPGVGGNTPAVNSLIGLENILINPQFADLYIPTPFTYTTANTYPIAPGWDLVLTGTGSTTVTQLPLAGNNNLPGNPPYALKFDSTGWTTVVLRQSIVGNGAIFANGGVALTFEAQAFSTNPTMTVTYSPSGTSNVKTIGSFTIASGTYIAYKSSTNIPSSQNANTGSAAFVNINFSLPETGIVALTNMQIVGQSTPIQTDAVLPSYQETTPEQQINAEFNLFKNSILMQPKRSILTAWNFGLNPWQFRAPATANAVGNIYTADQTILIQQAYVANVANTTNVGVGRDTFSNNYGFKVTAVTAHNQFAILQWIDASTSRPFWQNKLSALVKAFIAPGAGHTNSVGIKMRLIIFNGVPSQVLQNTPIATWTETPTPTGTINDPVAAVNYTLIPPINDPIYILNPNSPSFFAFNQFQLPVSLGDNMTLGVLLYTVGNMDQTGSPDSITINSVSLVPNDFAIESSPETFDETFRKCQFYYEKSYAIETLPATATYVGAVYQKATTYYDQITFTAPNLLVSYLYLSNIEVNFSQLKRDIPTVTFYSANSTNPNVIFGGIEQNDTFPAAGDGGHPPSSANANPFEFAIGNWTAVTSSRSRILLQTNVSSTAQINLPKQGTIPTASLRGDQAVFYFHYVADARIGR